MTLFSFAHLLSCISLFDVALTEYPELGTIERKVTPETQKHVTSLSLLLVRASYGINQLFSLIHIHVDDGNRRVRVYTGIVKTVKGIGIA